MKNGVGQGLAGQKKTWPEMEMTVSISTKQKMPSVTYNYMFFKCY